MTTNIIASIKSSIIISGTLLLVRPDGIGDYILFRNFIEILKNSSQYANYKIVLCGNIAWKNLAENLDGEFVDEFIWIDRNRFGRNLFYRYKKLKEIISKGYETVIQPIYSREFFYGDSIVKLVNAEEKIGNSGDLSNLRKWQRKISNKYYTRLIPADGRIMFEFNRNKEFFERQLSESFDISKPFIDVSKITTDIELPEEFAVLFIGASKEYKKWHIEKYAETAKYLMTEYDLDVVICGSSADIDSGRKLEKTVSSKRVINLVDKTTLVELCHIIAKSNIVISNETLAPHIAVAVDTAVISIYNGNQFGRFTPYPKEMADKYFPVYHPEIEKDLDNYKKLSNNYGWGSTLNINEISKERVFEIIDNCSKCGVI